MHQYATWYGASSPGVWGTAAPSATAELLYKLSPKNDIRFTSLYLPRSSNKTYMYYYNATYNTLGECRKAQSTLTTAKSFTATSCIDNPALNPALQMFKNFK